jgi:hypothetical protein
MLSKPPITRTGTSGWFGRRATRLKGLVVVGAVTLGFAGAAIAAAVPASADAGFQFTEVGSDTIQNMMDFFAGQVGGGVIGTYDAVNPLTQTAGEIITPELNLATPAGAQQLCSYTRPNGSGQGFNAMDFSYNPGTTLGQLASAPQAGCVTMSRSSSGPGSVSGTAGTPGSLLGTGNFVYVPFAIDAVDYATGPTTAISETIKCNGPTTPAGFTCSSTTGPGTVTFTTTPTTISQTADFTVAQLQTLYATCSPVTVGATTYNPGTAFSYTATSATPAVFTTTTASNLTAGTTVTLSGGTAPGGFTNGTPYFVVAPTATTFELAATSGGTAINSTSTGSGTVTAAGNIDLYAPQTGSGTLKFWQSTMGVTAPQACWHQTVIAGPGTGISVEEHDGAAVASDPNGIAPVSIAKWVAMNNAVTTPDVRHGDILQSITVSGTVVPPLSSGAMNVAGCLTGAGFNQATCFPITREVYNVLDFFEIINTPPPAGQTGNPAFNSTLGGLFASTSSTLCRSQFTITNLGFGNLPTANSAFPDQCGATTTGLRVQMNNTAAAG